jgi:chromosomal replication initiator protein
MTNPPWVWDGVLRRLNVDISAFALKAWVLPLTLEIDANVARLLCPTAFHRERVRERFLAAIQRGLDAELGRPVPLSLIVAAPSAAATAAKVMTSRAPGHGGLMRDPRTVPTAARPAERLPLTASPNTRRRMHTGAQFSAPESISLSGSNGRGKNGAGSGSGKRKSEQLSFPTTFESFVVGPCNALAREASYAVALDRQQCANPLFLTSDTGMGKTHLARAIIDEARRDGRQRVMYASAESFTNHFMTCIRSKQMDRFKRRYRYNDLLIVEDIQFLSAKTATQLELFHTITHLLDAGSRVVLTGDRLPRSLEKFDSRLCSQMSAGLVAELESPNAAVRRQILRSAAASGGVRLPDDCLDLLVEVVHGSLRDLVGVLIQLAASASLLKRPVDIELTESALRKVAPERHRVKRLRPTGVIDTVAAFFGTSADAMASRSRRHDVLHPRQIAMYLCRRYTDASTATIAGHFRRDHPAVSNAVNAVERRMLERPKLRYQVEELIARLDAVEADAR